MLCRRCGLCSQRNRKINVLGEEGGKNVSNTLENRISLPSVSTLLSLIAVFATASAFIVMQIKLVVVIHMSRTSEKLENIVAETLFPSYTKHFIAE